ncbi:MAG: bifunctional diaminohydroxyphosphoribosylaminopyrimidine deaminase/5-amino-6-(5-phosphoribosylamino)uracil reductase RibD [Pirellulaceae bacterium]|nr:bifunctional diaminohydroxyphosphoribosylaminopyrimidine deaminase/5-amino-6-(5-phosphoribosylamino)uracil reductase RibD [Pirellulaceae bacterium]
MPPSPSDSDEHFMSLALDLASRGEGLVEPNPMVGCVLARDDKPIGQGFHAAFGGPHAEIVALADLNSPQDAVGATAYVTLEPCCHHGKTPPCTDALIRSGVRRVVVAVQDPFAQVDGGGLKKLTDAGIDVTVGVLADRANHLLAPYRKRIRTGRPWVIAKWAMTADGRIATITGESQWITGAASRQQVHRLRGRVDLIAVGMGTIDADDPLLTARPAGPRTAHRVVFCRNRLPDVNSQLVQTAAQTPTSLVVGTKVDQTPLRTLKDCGVQVIACDTDDSGEMVTTALDHFGSMNLTNLMVEGGGELLASFIAADQVDECHVYVGPKLFGGQQAAGPIGGAGIAKLADAINLSLDRVDSFDHDVRMIYRKA